MLRESAANYAALATGDFPDVVSAQNPIDAFNEDTGQSQESFQYSLSHPPLRRIAMGALMPRHLYRRQTHNPMGDSK